MPVNPHRILAQRPEEIVRGVRGLILDAIDQDPGISFVELARAIGRPRGWGAVLFHLRVLERFGIIRTLKVGRYRCYFAADFPEPMKAALLRTEPYASFVRVVANHPTLSTAKLAEKAGVTRQAVMWRLNRCREAGISPFDVREREPPRGPVGPTIEAAAANVRPITNALMAEGG